MSNFSNNPLNIPQACQAMDRFKILICQEAGVNLRGGYNGHLTSREAGSVGGQMVRNVFPDELKNMTAKSVLLWDIYRQWCT